MVKGVRFVAGLGVAHLPYHLTAERVHHVKRLAADLSEDAADAILVHKPRHMHHDDVPFRGQGAFVARLPPYPEGRARLLELRFFVLAQQPVCAAAHDPPRAAAHERKRCEDAIVALHKTRSFHVAVYCLNFMAQVCQYGGVIFQQSAAVRTVHVAVYCHSRLQACPCYPSLKPWPPLRHALPRPQLVTRAFE